MVKKILCQGYLWLLLLLLYAPIFIIMIYSFTEAKVLGNWTGFSTKLYSSLFTTGTHHSLTNALINTLTIALIAATVSTLLGSITAIGIFNLRARSRKVIGFVNNIPYSEWRYYHRYLVVPAVCFAGYPSRIHYRGTGSHYILHPIRDSECIATSQTNESEYL